MIKSLFLLLLLFSIGFSKEYPTVFSQLGNPLYKSIDSLKILSDIEDLNSSCSNYIGKAKETLLFGESVDKSDKKAVKEYLKRLRKLQKEYDKNIYYINSSISSAIERDDYTKFLELTDCGLEGLLKSRVLLKKSIEYYKTHRTTQKSNYLEKKIDFSRLVQYHERESFNKSVTDSFDSSKKKSTSKKSVYLEAKNIGNAVVINIYNKNPYTVTLSVNAKYKNLSFDKTVPTTRVIKANSNIEYIRLYRNSAKASYSMSYSWIIGSEDAVHDDSYVYRLPYARGSSIIVSQGFNGEATHKGSSKYAVDFMMKEGTKIYAARSGVVVRTKSDSNRGGFSKEFASSGNYITIAHSDDTFATYYHLKRGGVAVKVGDKVNRGDHIGYSGNTGYSSGPHLHFAVFKAASAKSTQSLPIKFLSTSGVIDNPKRGVSYRAQ